ncbi:hypothetical protein J2X14_001613 [Pantoea alhagi]|uniref:hypothetical protein n=1 Tax=Mixta sp. BE291 TaxID=3158787 RepID=UPI00285D9864|nr:hypothetical protein [Pantoea alhagi]
MAIKSFYYSQLADLRIEGVGLHASYSIHLVIKDENMESGKHVYVAATGRSNAAKAAGSGKLLFWCKVRTSFDNKTYVLERAKGDVWATGIDDIVIGATSFFLPITTWFTPSLEVEAGYFYDSGHTGTVPPMPPSMKRLISLTPFQR